MRFRLKPNDRSDSKVRPTDALSTKPPTVRVTGDLTDERCIALIDEIQTLRDQHFFDAVKLRITSPGGAYTALQYLSDSLRDMQHGGMTVATHAVAGVASAAAVLLSIGDIRTAHPKARLTYHHGRFLGVNGPVTAHFATTIASSLSTSDGEVVALLADRALTGPPPAPDTPEDIFAPDDWLVIERLCHGHGHKRSKMLKLLRRRVTKAFKSPSQLKSLYGDLCQLDTVVSPHLALELGLLDGVGDGCPTATAQDNAADVDGLTVPEWDALYPGGRVPRFALTRHTLILGETGSGKTASGVLPVVSAITHQDSPVSCALLIDPKEEIGPAIDRLAGPNCTVRTVRVGEDALDVMGKSNSVNEAVAQGRWLSAAQQILARAASLADSPARIFAGKSASGGKEAYWENEGSRFARCVLAVALILSTHGRLSGLLSDDRLLSKLLREQLTGFGELAGLLSQKGGQEPPVNVLALAQRALDDLFVLDDSGGRFPAMSLMGAIERAELTSGDHNAVRRELKYFQAISISSNQYAGLLGEARFCFSAFADPRIARSLFFGVEERMTATVDFVADVEADDPKDRVIYLYQPALRKEGATLVAKALKAGFFEAILTSPARRDRGSQMPLAFYVADEFQRFVTADSAHGEQSFLDTCRSFGAGCVLATQSTASILHALETAGEPSPRTAIEILLSNTASKLLFRSTGRGARDIVGDLCPGEGPDRVVAVRPPATLRPGECYASLPDGRFERRQLRQLRQFEPD